MISWQTKKLGDIATVVSGGTPDTTVAGYWGGDIQWITPSEITKTGRKITNPTEKQITALGLRSSAASLIPKNSIILCSRATIGECAISTYPITTNQGFKNLIPKETATVEFLYYWIKVNKKTLVRISSGSTFLEFSKADLEKLKLQLPEKTEQERIVRILETWDEYIEKLEQKIALKEQLKKGLMQQLLTGKLRLTGFNKPWIVRKMGDFIDCLDGKRIPINSTDREKMKGNIPYCGANGIVDYIDNYIFDEDIILIAEDGGQFDEYANRPIAYRMKGKTWVNNHAHVIRTKDYVSQDFIFFATVHKNILRYLNGGTRAKLNKSELLKIKYYLPEDKSEQNETANIVNNIYSEIETLMKVRTEIIQQKRYLLKNLITGTIRTPEHLTQKGVN